MSDIQIINPIEFSGWDDLLLANETYSFFHSMPWANVLAASYQYEPMYFTSTGQNGSMGIVPIMEINTLLSRRRAISLPFTDACEPIAPNKDHFQHLLSYIIPFGRKKRWTYLEIRGGHRFLDSIPPSSQYYQHTLKLSKDEKHIFKNFRKGTKSSIKKAKKDGVEVNILTTSEALHEFYRLHCLTRKKHGVPPQPLYFFKNIYSNIITKNLGWIALASYRGKAIAGGIFFHLGKKAIYKYGASDTTYQRLGGTNLILWEVIQRYCRNGFEDLCFGRTDFENEGLRRFKNGWNTEESIIHYYKYQFDKNAFIIDQKKSATFTNRVFAHFPIVLLKTIGLLAYKHMA